MNTHVPVKPIKPMRPPHPALRATFPFCSFPSQGKGDRRRKAAVDEVNERNRAKSIFRLSSENCPCRRSALRSDFPL